jgi:hypothetical protein
LDRHLVFEATRIINPSGICPVQNTNKHLAPGDIHEELTWSLAMHHVARDCTRRFREEVAEGKIGGDDVLVSVF